MGRRRRSPRIEEVSRPKEEPRVEPQVQPQVEEKPKVIVDAARQDV